MIGGHCYIQREVAVVMESAPKFWFLCFINSNTNFTCSKLIIELSLQWCFGNYNVTFSPPPQVRLLIILFAFELGRFSAFLMQSPLVPNYTYELRLPCVVSPTIPSTALLIITGCSPPDWIVTLASYCSGISRLSFIQLALETSSCHSRQQCDLASEGFFFPYIFPDFHLRLLWLQDGVHDKGHPQVKYQLPVWSSDWLTCTCMQKSMIFTMKIYRGYQFMALKDCAFTRSPFPMCFLRKFCQSVWWYQPTNGVLVSGGVDMLCH